MFPITYRDGAIWQINEKHTKIRTGVKNGRKQWKLSDSVSVCDDIYCGQFVYLHLLIYQTLLSRVTYKCDPGAQNQS